MKWSITSVFLLALSASATEPRFTDVTDPAGITFAHQHGGTGHKYLPETMGSGGCALDYDGDGWTDLYLVQSGPLPPTGEGGNRLYRNFGNSRFEDVTVAARAAGQGYGQGAVCGDVNGDSFVDIYVTAFGRNHLLLNLGDGRFEDTTERSGTRDSSWSSSAVLFDADVDLDLDLYVVNYLDFTLATHRDCRRGELLIYCHPDAYPAAADRFFRNRGDGTFEEATTAAGFTETSGKGLGAVALDYDRDGLTDLYVTNDSTPNFLFRNLGAGRFEEVGLLAGAAVNEAGKTSAGMGVDAGDVDGDGFFDLVVTNLSLEANSLFRSDGVGFRDATRASGLYAPSYNVLGFGVDFLDFDHDGDLDLAVVNGDVLDNIAALSDGLTYEQPGQLFENNGAGRFRELAAAEVGDFALPRVGRGLITLDFDRDGDLDLAASYNHGAARLFANTGRRGRWLSFRLEGAGAVGSLVSLKANGRTQSDELRLGGSYQVSHEPSVHFGLGDSTSADAVEIRRPDGHRVRLLNLPADRSYSVPASPLLLGVEVLSNGLP